MRKNIFVSIYVLINYFLCFINLFYERKIFSYLNILIGLIAFAILLLAQLTSKKETFLPLASFVFLAVLLLLMTTNILLVGNYTIGNVVGVVFSFCVLGFYLLKFEIHRFFCYLIFYSFVGLVVLVLVGIINVAEDSWEFFASTSRNYVSFFLIYSMFPLCISSSLRKETLPIIPLIITLVLSILAVGRGGIIMSAFLFLFSLFFTKTKNVSKKKKCLLFLIKISIVVAIVFIIIRQDILEEIAPRFFMSGNFEVKDTSRLKIWGTYFDNINSFESFVFGYNSLASTGLKGQGNLHNSFLQLHTNIGFFGLVLFILAISFSACFLIKKKEFQLLVFLITILFKGAVDLSFGFYYGDVIIVFFILYPFYQRFIVTKKECSVLKIVNYGKYS